MEKKAYFKVTEMHCSNCAMRLQSMEDDVPGVKQVDASYQKQQMVVLFDDAVISEKEISAAAEKLGYPAVLM
jgi:copper chaperone CopZ